MTVNQAGKTVVVDNGTGCITAGFAGDMFPKARVATLVGRTVSGDISGDSSSSLPSSATLGDACNAHGATLNVTRPIVNGTIQRWDDMELLWQHILERELKVDPVGSRIIVSDPPMNPQASRERMVEVMFEKFGFEGISLQPAAVLSLYSQGLTTGIVVDSGVSLTTVVPVLEGHVEHTNIRRLHVAGAHVTERLRHLVQFKGHAVASAGTALFNRMKERCCYTAVDRDKETALARETTCLNNAYQLPDGQTINIAQERFWAPEVLFSPAILGFESEGLSETIHDVIHSLPIDTRLGMYKAVLLAGGTMMLPGMSTRLERDLRGLYLDRILKGREEGLAKLRARILDPPVRRHIVYSGAAVLAEVMAEYDDYWVSRASYAEDPRRAIKELCKELQ